MNKMKSLQILVYITFALFLLQDAAGDIVKGFKEGWHDGYYAGHHDNQQRGPLLRAMLDGSTFNHFADSGLKVNPNYTLEDITVNADVRLNHPADTAPWWLTPLHFLVVLGIAVILFITARTINKVIVKIANGTMFDDACIAHIRKVALLLLLFTLVDYAYQWIDHLNDTILIHAPLKLVNTTSFNFPVLICAILVYLIAEAFKQGAILKHEQELTI